ncbi:MAG: amidase [Actinobacteria bacterium]|nr:amidase [Actinomycetota bacterium]
MNGNSGLAGAIASAEGTGLAEEIEPGPPTGPAFVLGTEVAVPRRAFGPLRSVRLAVKDVFDVAGLRTGCGNPARLAAARPAGEHADVVGALLQAGAAFVGKTVSDEFAFSMAGTNVHYGTPPNPRAPGRIPGGSSSGSASAVASGACDLALGTDTGGSIRVPASYCGIAGFRPTHGRISVAGMEPLAPSFDTIGLMARDPVLLRDAWLVLDAHARVASYPAPGPTRDADTVIITPQLWQQADPELTTRSQRALRDLAGQAGLRVETSPLDPRLDPAALRDSFHVLELAEVWTALGDWVGQARPTMGPGVAARFAAAAAIGPEQVARAQTVRDQARRALVALLRPGALLAYPSTFGVAPPARLPRAAKDQLRLRTQRLTVMASMTGAPALSLPLATDGRYPCGVDLLGLPGDDEIILDVPVRAQAGPPLAVEAEVTGTAV